MALLLNICFEDLARSVTHLFADQRVNCESRFITRTLLISVSLFKTENAA